MRRFQINEQIGNYTVTAFLGAGGMGEVYRGVQTNLNRTAAIKVLKNVHNQSLISRFRNEARLQSGLHHPHIAALYDFQEIGGQLCIFMEYVDGEGLEDLVRRRFFAVEEALIAFYSVCEAVGFIHRSGIVHRDIKAQNIKLNSRGIIKLLDFGIAKDAESQKLTKTGGVIGTPGYIAPEQFSGTAADFQTDVWALGILLYEMLTGTQPFDADALVELCLKIESGEYLSVERANPAVPREITRIVEGCLQKDKNRRYRNAGELAQETARVLKDKYGLVMSDSGTFSRVSKAVSTPETQRSENVRAGQDFVSRSAAAAQKKQTWLFPVLMGSAAAVLVVFALVGITIWAMSGNGQTNKNSKAPKSNVISVEKKSDLPKNRKQPLIETVSETSEAGEVQIDVIEGSAELVRNGENAGKTPFTLRGKIGEKIDIKLRREGYRDFETQIEVSSGKKFYTFALQKK